MKETPSVLTHILPHMRNPFNGDLRARKRVEAILDHKKFFNNEDFIDSLNKQLQILYGKNAKIEILKKSFSGRYFNMSDRSEVIVDESEEPKIARSSMKPQSGSDAFYTQVFTDNHHGDTDCLIIKVSGIKEKHRDQVLRGMRDLREQFRKTHTAIDIQNQDALTGLYNRRFLEEYARERDIRQDKNYAVVFIDLVDLKGHNNVSYKVGDGVIKKFAEILKKRFPRKTDLVARAGGDEFTVILEFPGDMTYDEQKAFIDEKINALLDELALGENETGKFVIEDIPRRVSALCGVAYKRDDRPFWELYDKAGEISKFDKKLDGVAARAEEGSRELIPTVTALLSLTQALQTGLKRLYGIEYANRDIVVERLGDILIEQMKGLKSPF